MERHLDVPQVEAILDLAFIGQDLPALAAQQKVCRNLERFPQEIALHTRQKGPLAFSEHEYGLSRARARRCGMPQLFERAGQRPAHARRTRGRIGSQMRKQRVPHPPTESPVHICL